MFHEESLVTFIFKIINVLVMIFGSIYLYKKYVVKQLRELFFQARAHELQLKDDEARLRSNMKIVETELHAQQQWVVHMEKNITTWKTQLRQYDAHVLLARKKIQQQLDSVYTIKEQYMTELAARRVIMPTARDQARKALMQTFSNEKEQQQFIAHVITMMKKSDHESR